MSRIETGAATPKAAEGRSAHVVAIDGPSSSGKSSVGAAAARALGYRFCDTGLLYRALTRVALDRGVDLDDADAVLPFVEDVQLADDGSGRLVRVFDGERDVTDLVHAPDVDRAVSRVARLPAIRTALLSRQRHLAAAGRIVMAGRDIGTVVLPDADLKIYLDASAEERARRRAEERGLEAGSPEALAILVDLRSRDEIDSNRSVAPLRAATDAVRVRSDGRTFEQTVATVADLIRGHRDPADRPDWFIRGTDLVGRTIIRSLARAELTGLEHLRGLRGPLLIVANHVSNADAPIIGSFLTQSLGRRIYWLGKEEALGWPVIGFGLRRNAVIGVRRGAADVEGFRSAMRVLEDGHVLCVFPEGTRSRTGALGDAKDGTAVLALRTSSPILPVGVLGTRTMWPRGQRLPHPGGRVGLRIGEPFVLPAAEVGKARRASHRAATVEIMRRIAVLLPEGQRGAHAQPAEPTEGPPADPVR